MPRGRPTTVIPAVQSASPSDQRARERSPIRFGFDSRIQLPPDRDQRLLPDLVLELGVLWPNALSIS